MLFSGSVHLDLLLSHDHKLEHPDAEHFWVETFDFHFECSVYWFSALIISSLFIIFFALLDQGLHHKFDIGARLEKIHVMPNMSSLAM